MTQRFDNGQKFLYENPEEGEVLVSTVNTRHNIIFELKCLENSAISGDDAIAIPITGSALFLDTMTLVPNPEGLSYFVYRCRFPTKEEYNRYNMAIGI